MTLSLNCSAIILLPLAQLKPCLTESVALKFPQCCKNEICYKQVERPHQYFQAPCIPMVLVKVGHIFKIWHMWMLKWKRNTLDDFLDLHFYA